MHRRSPTRAAGAVPGGLARRVPRLLGPGLSAAILLATGLSGCATPPASAPLPPGLQRPLPADLDARATVPLEELPPLPPLPAADAGAGGPVPDEALKHYLAGLALAKAYQEEQALEQFEAAARADPKGFEPRMALAHAAMQVRQLDKAQNALQEAIAVRPADAEARYLLGVVLLARERSQPALENLRLALALMEEREDRGKVLFYLAQALQREGYLLAATQAALRFEALAADEQTSADEPWAELVSSLGWRIPVLRGDALRQLGQYPAAVEAYRRAQRMAPDRLEVRLALAQGLVDAGHLDEAAEVAEDVLAEEPRSAQALAVLAATLLAQQKVEELDERLLGVVKAAPEDTVLAQRVAAVLLRFGRQDAALAVLRISRAAAQEPAVLYPAFLQVVFAHEDAAAAVERLAALLAELDEAAQQPLLAQPAGLDVNPCLVQDVSRQAAALLESAGQNVPRLLALALVAEAAGNLPLAEQALRAALRVEPDSLRLTVALAERLLAQARWQEAIRLAEPMLRTHPDAAALYRVVGAAYDGLDYYKPALTNLYEALRRNPRDPRSMWLAAQINERLGQARSAVPIYQALVVVQPDHWAAHLGLVRNYILTNEADLARDHAQRLRGLFGETAAVELVLLIAETGRAIPPSQRVAALLRRYPDDALLLRALGEAHVAEGRAADALPPLTRLLGLEPQDEQGRLLLTTALARALEFDLAEQVLRSLLAEHPNRYTWRFALAELLTQAGRPAEAVEVLRDLLDRDWEPQQREALVSRLLFNLQYAGRYDEAIARVEEDLAAAPQDRGNQTLLLSVLEAAGRREEALRRIEQWRQAAPDDPLLVRLHVQFLRATGRNEEAAAVAMGAAGLTPSATQPEGAAGTGPAASQPSEQDLLLVATSMPPAEALAWLAGRPWEGHEDLRTATAAELLSRQGRYREAAETASLLPISPEGLAEQAQWRLMAGDRAAAELFLMPAAQDRDKDLHVRLRRLLPTYYKRMGLEALSLEAAQALYDDVRADPRQAVEVGNDLAYALSEAGAQLPLAEQLARQAVGGDPGNAAYQDTLGWVYYKLGRFDQAIRWLEQAIRQPYEGRDAVLYDHLGDALWRVGRRQEAVAMWREADRLFRREIEAGSTRLDLEQAPLVRRKIEAAEAGRPVPIAGCAGQRR